MLLHSDLEFMVRVQVPADSSILLASSICLLRLSLKVFRIVILNLGASPLWNWGWWVERGFDFELVLMPSRCSRPLVYPAPARVSVPAGVSAGASVEISARASAEVLTGNPVELLKLDPDYPHKFRSIYISDAALEHLEECMPDSTTPLVYEGANVTANEAEALTLHPKMALYPNITPRDFYLELEKTFTKLRWSFMSEQTQGEENQETLQNPGTQANPDALQGQGTQANPISRTPCLPQLDFYNKKVTDLPTNRETIMPKHAGAKHEGEILALKPKPVLQLRMFPSGTLSWATTLTGSFAQTFRRV